MKGKGKRPSQSSEPPQTPFNNPFSALAGKRDALPVGAAPAKSSAPVAQKAVPARAVVRYERKGRGGKEVTVVEQLGLSAKERAAWLKALKQALGCGGVEEDEALVLQGDQRERVRGWLASRGVKKVSVG